MQAYRIETIIPSDGVIELTALPFARGEKVEIIILGPDVAPQTAAPRVLAGSVLKYDDPFEPVRPDDWDVLS